MKLRVIPFKNNVSSNEGSHTLLKSALFIETLDPANGPNSGNAGKTECNSNQHKCNALDYSTAKCIPRSWMCDSDVDCEDGSDEAECEKTSCNSSDPQSDPQFR